ncbi:hypothetical protein A3K70_01660 [Candidatus Bathyarchaeota archaeon RBG_16_48_13]|nr:MAG: hypothetical protein A3K70_01660 [Candidatus Bathyarchaeota archaeon RBG_16_48_13]
MRVYCPFCHRSDGNQPAGKSWLTQQGLYELRECDCGKKFPIRVLSWTLGKMELIANERNLSKNEETVWKNNDPRTD